jgi:uncharacterized membrane protein YfcA
MSIVVSAACGVSAGGHLAGGHVSKKALRPLFIAIILALAAYKMMRLCAEYEILSALSSAREQRMAPPLSR